MEDSQERGGESLIGFDIGGGAVSNLADRIAALSPEQRRLLHQRLREQRSSGGEPSSSTSIPRRGEGDAAAVSYAQERFWFLSKFVPESSAYHIPLRIGLRGALKPGRAHGGPKPRLGTARIVADGFCRKRR